MTQIDTYGTFFLFFSVAAVRCCFAVQRVVQQCHDHGAREKRVKQINDASVVC